MLKNILKFSDTQPFEAEAFLKEHLSIQSVPLQR
jgi:hypothetical protein